MPATLQVPQGFEPDTIPVGFEPDSVPQGFEPDAPTSTATTPPPSPVELKPESARNIPSITATTSGGPPLQLPDAKVAMASAAGEISEGFGEVLTHPSPISTPFTIDKNEHPLVATGKEIVNLAVGIPQFFTTGLGIGAAAAGTVAPAVVAGLFTVDLLKSLGEQIHSTYKNWPTMTGAEKAVAVTDVVGTGVFAGLTGRHTVKGAVAFAESNIPRGQGIASPELKILAPQTAAAISETPDATRAIITEVQGENKIQTPVAVAPEESAGLVSRAAEEVAGEIQKPATVLGRTQASAKEVIPTPEADAARFYEIQDELKAAPFEQKQALAQQYFQELEAIKNRNPVQKGYPPERPSVNALKETGAAAGTPTDAVVEQPAAVKPVESKPEMVTVYRGEGTAYSKEKLASLPEHIRNYAGEWFTTKKADAKNYAATVGGKVRTVSIPQSELETYRISETEEFRIPKSVQEKYSAPSPKSTESVKLKAGQNQGEFPAEDLTLRGESGVDSERINAEKKAKEDSEKDAAAFEEKNQSDLFQEPELVVAEGDPFAIAKPGDPLAPATTSPNPSLTPKSQRQIITDIAKGLKLPIRFGRLTTTKFGGYFKSVANLIGSKRADDIPIVSHEAGHKLDKTFSLSADATLRPELDVLGDPATPGSRSSWTKSKTRKYKMGEGVAEFTRHWLTDPAHAKKVAPNTFSAFEKALDSNKDFGDTMRQAQQDIALWRNADPQARLRSQISIGENPNKTRYTLSQLTRDLVDDLHILRLATLDAAPKGSFLPPSLDPYLLARNLRGSYGMAATFIRDGVVDFKTKAVQLGTGLEDAIKPVAGRLNDFRDWIVAKRAQELRSQGRESGLVSSDIDAVAKKFDADADFQKAFQSVKEWNDALLQYAVDSGLIIKGTPRTQKEGPTGSYAIREMNQDYVPFHRVFEVGAGESPSQQAGGVGAGLNVGKPGSLKGLKGSPRQIVDPFETMVKNAYTIITASEKAAINFAVADMSKLPDMGKWVERIAAPKERVEVELGKIREELDKAGVDSTGVPDDLLLSFFRQSRGTPFGENIIRVSRDGKAEFYRLNRDLHDTFKALDLEDSGKLVRILSAPAQLLRAGVVLEPSFNIANVLRDTFSAAVIGKYGALPFETTLRGMAAMVKDPKLVAEWAASGGKSAVEASYFDRAKIQKFLSERIAKDLSPADRALIVARSPLSALRWLTSAFEEATRIGEYKIALEKLRKGGMPDGEARRLAAFEARDRQDFAKGGAKTKIVRHMAAFWNASLQANVKLAQAFKDRPVRTTLQGLAFITIPKLIEQAINWNDDDYWARKQWERDLFFLIPIGKDKSGHTRFLRLPTPFEVGIIFGTFPGRILQGIREESPESMKSFPSLFLKQSVPNPVPQAYQVIFEDFLSGKKGWDVWRGRTIVPESLADEPPEMQWTEQTSGIAKKAGNALKFSPMKIDHLIERTTGGMGKLATGRAVPGQRFITAPLTVSNQATETFYDRLEAVREDAARAKAANKPMPANYAAFQSTERALSALRKRARETKDLDQKARLQEQMLKTTTEFLKRHPATSR